MRPLSSSRKCGQENFVISYRAAELLNNKNTLSILLDEIERLDSLDSGDGKDSKK